MELFLKSIFQLLKIIILIIVNNVSWSNISLLLHFCFSWLFNFEENGWQESTPACSAKFSRRCLYMPSHIQEKAKPFILNSICSRLPDTIECQEQKWYYKNRNLITQSVLQAKCFSFKQVKINSTVCDRHIWD